MNNKVAKLIFLLSLGATAGLWQDCGLYEPAPEPEGSGDSEGNPIDLNITTIATEIRYYKT